jgi:hypothetical protein
MIRLGAALRDHPVIAESGAAHRRGAVGGRLRAGRCRDLGEVPQRQGFRHFHQEFLGRQAGESPPRDTGGFEPPAEPGRSEVTVAPLGDGWVRLVATLAPQDAEVVACVDAQLHRALCRRRGGDPAYTGLSPAQIRAEGLVDLLAQTMRKEPSEHSVPGR